VEALRGAREAEASALSVAAEREGELEQLMHRLAEAEATAAHERERVGAWEREREQLAAELREAAARERQVREDLRAAMERSAAAPGEDLNRALERVRAAEEARTIADADARAARGALTSAEAP